MNNRRVTKQRKPYSIPAIAAAALVAAASSGGAWAESAARQAASTIPFQGRIKMTQYRGQWSASQTYRKGQVVFYGDQSWIALRNNINRGSSLPIPPALQNTNWSLFSALGPASAQGPTGAQGPAGPQGAAGAPGPQGETGAPGPQGNAGPQGPQGPAIVGPIGTQGTQGPVGPQGATGAQGPQGATGATGPQGSQGVKGDAGPQGSQGPAGTSGTSAGAYKGTVSWTADTPVWTVPSDFPSPKFLATITGTLNWKASGAVRNPSRAECTVIGLTGVGTPGNPWIKRKVTVSWDYNTLANVPTSWPTEATSAVSFTGYVDQAASPTITLKCLMTVDGVDNKVPDVSEAEITLVNLDSVKPMP